MYSFIFKYVVLETNTLILEKIPVKKFILKGKKMLFSSLFFDNSVQHSTIKKHNVSKETHLL